MFNTRHIVLTRLKTSRECKNGKYRSHRQGRWKLQWLEDQDRIWLFDLERDPLEANNLTNEMPEQVASMMRDIRAIDQDQLPPAWPPQLEIPLAIDKTLEEGLKEDDESIVFTH